jgi:hypothetical protein
VIAVAIGNGESRAGVNLNKFKKDHVLVGCNALHRDIVVDHLVCCDRRMIEESLSSNNTYNTEIYVRNDWLNFYSKQDSRIKQVPQLPYEGNTKADMPIHWGSGPYAVLVAATLSVDTVMLLGFDLYSKDQNFNNVYKDTKHYKSKESSPVDHSFWEYQIAKVFENFPNKNFVILNDNEWILPTSWNRPNVVIEVLATKNLTSA